MHFFKKWVVVTAVSGKSFLFSVILAILKISSSMPKESVAKFNHFVKSLIKHKEFVSSAIKVIHFIMVLVKAKELLIIG